VVADPAIETIISKLVESAGLLDTLIVLFVRDGRQGWRVEMKHRAKAAQNTERRRENLKAKKRLVKV
jgi:hypothetical protein